MEPKRETPKSKGIECGSVVIHSRQWTSKRYGRPMATITNVRNGEENKIFGRFTSLSSAPQPHKIDDDNDSIIDRKIFVGGLHKHTTSRSLFKYFSKFGEICRIELKLTREGVSRCFGFIVFQAKDTVKRVLNVPQHIVDGKVVDANRALPRTAKVYVGGVKNNMTAETLRKYFSRFGKIIDVEMPYDYEHNCRKEFAFVTYESKLDAKRVIMNTQHQIDGYVVDVNWATPKTVLLRQRGLVPGAYPFQGQYQAAERNFKYQNIYHDAISSMCMFQVSGDVLYQMI